MAEMSYKIIMKYNCSKFTLFVQNIKKHIFLLVQRSFWVFVDRKTQYYH